MKLRRYNFPGSVNGWSLLVGILYIWMSTVGVLNHDDDFLYKHTQSAISSHNQIASSIDDGCAACQWMVGSLSAAASHSILPSPEMFPRAEAVTSVESFHTHDFHHIPPRGPPA